MSHHTSNPDGLPEILPVPGSLRRAGAAAWRVREPLVVMVTLKGCAFCDVVRNNYLGPMMARQEVFAIQVNMLDRRTALEDFAGLTTTPYAQARAWGARIAPTLLFVDAQGRELADRLEGMTVADFYGDYLRQRIDQSRLALRL